MKCSPAAVVGVCALAVAAWLAAPPVAAAPAKDRASEVLKLTREALDLYDLLEFDLARKSLVEALEVGQAAGMSGHALIARAHATMGLVLGVGLKDETGAVEHFKKALTIRPDYKLGNEHATPAVQRWWARAQRELREPPPAEKLDDTQITALLESTPGSGALKCPTAGEVQAGDDITLKCIISAQLRPTTVVLYYKRRGQGEFTSLQMTGDGGERRATWVARIPGEQVSGKMLPFYFEARDGRGEAVALAGRNDSPNILTIRGDATSSSPEVEQGDENPLVEIERRKDLPTETRKRFFVGLGVGSGGGYAKGDGLEAYHAYARGFTPGLAMAGVAHAVPEFGYFLTPTFALSLQGRHQYIPRETKYTAPGAHALLARALFFTGDGPLRLYGALALGGGEGFRLVVHAATTNNSTIKDTVKGGPVVAGGGGGLSYAFGDTWSWMLESNALAGFPTFSAVIDVNTGVRAGF